MEHSAETLSVMQVTYEVYSKLKGQSPLVAVLGWVGPSVLLIRDQQRWRVTIQEIPKEKR